MTNERIPTDPYRPLDTQGLRDEYSDRRQRFDDDLPVDPDLAEGRANGGKIALFALCIALVLGAVFYGLNNSSINQASTEPPAQTAQTQPATPQAPPGMRNVTPKTNSEPGVTTGAAPNRPAPPAASPTDPDTTGQKQ